MKFSKNAVNELKAFFNEVTNSENVKGLSKDPFQLCALRKSFRSDEVFEFGLKAFLNILPNKYRLPNLSPNKREFDVAIFCIYIGAPEGYINRAYKILKENNATLQQFETLGVPSLWFDELKENSKKPMRYLQAYKAAEKKCKTPKVNAPDPSLYFEKRDNEEIDNCRLCLNAALFGIAFLATAYITYKNPNVFSSLGSYFKDALNSKLNNFSIFSHYDSLINNTQLFK